MRMNPFHLIPNWLALGGLLLALTAPVQAGTVNVALTEAPIFGATADPGMIFSGSMEVSGYSGTGAGLFTVTSAQFELADANGTSITFDTNDPNQFLYLDGALSAEFDVNGNLLDFVDDGDSGAGAAAGWGIQSIFFINEAAGTTKYDLFFDNSPSNISFWTLFPQVKTLGPGDFGLSYGSMLRSGTYDTAANVTAVPTGPMAPVLVFGLLGLMLSRIARRS